MKKIVFALCLIAAIAASSCQKNKGTANGGYWTFKSARFTATSGSFVAGALTGYTGTNTPTGSLSLYIPIINDSVITGVFPVTSTYPPDSTHVYVLLTDTSIYESYIPTPGTTGTVAVTKLPSGRIQAVLSPVEVVNLRNNYSYNGLQPTGAPSGTDSSLLSGTIIQTQ